MIWNNVDPDLLFSAPAPEMKQFSKQNSTMMSSNIQSEENTEFKRLLVEAYSFIEEKEDFLSDNNSLFDLK